MIKSFMVFLFVIVIFLQTSSNDFVYASESNKAWNERMKLFKEMGKNMRQLKRADNTSIMVKSAVVINSNAKKFDTITNLGAFHFYNISLQK